MKETIFNSVTRFLILDKFCIKPAKKNFFQNFKIFMGLFPLKQLYLFIDVSVLKCSHLYTLDWICVDMWSTLKTDRNG